MSIQNALDCTLRGYVKLARASTDLTFVDHVTTQLHPVIISLSHFLYSKFGMMCQEYVCSATSLVFQITAESWMTRKCKSTLQEFAHVLKQLAWFQCRFVFWIGQLSCQTQVGLEKGFKSIMVSDWESICARVSSHTSQCSWSYHCSKSVCMVRDCRSPNVTWRNFNGLCGLFVCIMQAHRRYQESAVDILMPN